MHVFGLPVSSRQQREPATPSTVYSEAFGKKYQSSVTVDSAQHAGILKESIWRRCDDLVRNCTVHTGGEE